MRAIVRFAREHPVWAALAAVGVCLAGFWGWGAWKEARARARMIPVLEAWIAAHPRPAAPVVPVDEDALPILREAVGAVTREGDGQRYIAVDFDTRPLEEVESWVMANGKALALLEEAVQKPGCSQGDLFLMDLAGLAAARGRVLFAKGDRAGAVRSFLLIHRATGCLGVDRSPSPVASSPRRSVWPLLLQLEEPGLEEGSVRQVLDQVVSPEIARQGFLEDDAGGLASAAEALLDLLRPGGVDRAIAMGYQPKSYADDLQVALGLRKPARHEMLQPAVVEVETLWSILLEFHSLEPHRGKRALDALDAARIGPDLVISRGDILKDHSMRSHLRSSVLRGLSLEGWLAVLRGAAAVRLHEVRTGALPGGWEDVVPSILPSAPEDPFADAPLRFDRGPQGVVIECSWPPDGNEELPMITPEGRGRRPRAVLRPAAEPK